jgi:hypothetical protein
VAILDLVMVHGAGAGRVEHLQARVQYSMTSDLGQEQNDTPVRVSVPFLRGRDRGKHVSRAIHT